VWLFQDFEAADGQPVPQLLSDHPDNQHRVATLKQHFSQNPQVFASFSSDPAKATALVVPKNAPAVFLR
jgi:hypothetical protein